MAGTGEKRDVVRASGAGDPGPLSRLLRELAASPGDEPIAHWKQELVAGDRVGRYEIRGLLGQGGFGAVYSAHDTELGRLVALKTLRPGRAPDNVGAGWIEQEAEAIARLDHPNIVTIFDVGRCDSGPFLVEELLHGETLAQGISREPLSPPEALLVAREVALGLAHAHQRGVLHRDLKPGNVFVCEDGRVKILDFGLAHLLGSTGSAGSGTPGYMPPEQRRGDVVDARADVFAAAMTLRRTLIGDGESSKGSRIPGALERLLAQALSPRRDDRPRDGLAWLEALDEVVRARARPRKLALAGGAALAAVALAGILVAVASRTGRPASSPAAPDRPSVAVLPFADLSTGRDQEPFAEGVAEEIRDALAQVENLHVTGRTSSFSFKGKQLEPGEVARRLRVANVLEGSVRRHGDRVRITAQLVDGARGFTIWSRTFDRDVSDLFAVQDEIAREVVAALKVKLLPGRDLATTWTRTGSAEAHERFLVGRELLRHGSLEDCSRALRALERSVELDPGYAPGWAALSVSAQCVAGNGDEGQGPLVDLARSSAERAVLLAPGLPDGHLARGGLRMNFEYDWSGARSDLEKALALSPASGPAIASVAYLEAAQGRMAEAARLARGAVELDPLSPAAWNVLGAVLLLAGDLGGAMEAVHRALEISPDVGAGSMTLCNIHLVAGRPRDALAVAESSTDEAFRLYCSAQALHDLGEATRSDEALRRLEAAHPVSSAYQIAQVHARRAEPDQAFVWLARARDVRDPGLSFAPGDPMLKGLRTDSRWAPFLGTMNLRKD